MQNRMKVLSLGALAMDVVIVSNSLPENDGFALIENEVVTPGGSAANVSVALQLLGAQVYQTGKIGDDAYGRLYRQDLIDQGLNVDYLVVKPGGITLHTYVLTAPKGRHCIFANPGDCVMNLEPDDLPNNAIDGIDCFYTDMFSPRASLWLGEKAKAAGVPVVYNMQCPPALMAQFGVSHEDIFRMISLSTVLIGGSQAYMELMGERNIAACLEKLYTGYGVADGVICSGGDKGVLWHGKEGLAEIPPFLVEAVDTTGAGDCFCAGLIFERYLKAGEMQRALRFACGVAALKCRVPGPRSRATLLAVQGFLNSRGHLASQRIK